MDMRVARLRDFLAVDPANIELTCELLDALHAQGDFAGVDDVLARADATVIAAPGVAFRAARSHLVHGRYADAEQALQSLIAAGHGSTAVVHDLAFSQLCQRRADDAARTLSDPANQIERNTAIRVLEARIALMQERHDEALAMLQEALVEAPDDPTVQGVQALALLDAGQTDAARDTAMQCLQSSPDQHEALLAAGTAALWSQDVDAAGTLYARALERHPNSGRALSGQGQVALLHADLDRGLALLTRATQTMPDHIGTWHALAWAQLLSGRRHDARTSYERAYAIDRNFGDTHGGLALVDALDGEIDAAEQGIKRALRLDPDSMTARYAQTLVMDARGDAAGSEIVMQGLLQDGPNRDVPAAEFAARLRATLTSTRH